MLREDTLLRTAARGSRLEAASAMIVRTIAASSCTL
jgi:hypothetical protein